MMATRHYMGMLLIAALAAVPAGAKAKLTLRINDTVGVPGKTAAIVLRTYASRPIEQGQLCLEATPAPNPGGSGGPATNAPSAEVYSAQSDVTSSFSADLSSAVQQFVVNFTSPSGSVNSVDGPLAVIFIELSPALVPGQTYDLVLDELNTQLFDANGDAIEIRPRNGVLTIRDPYDPVAFGIDAEDAAPGEFARVSVNTRESLPLESGHVGVAFDPAIATGPPTVSSDPRYGNVDLSVDVSTPGLVLVDFTSPDDSFNRIPGNLINVHIPTSPEILSGTQTPVTLTATTVVRTFAGRVPTLNLFGDLLNLSGQMEWAGKVENLRVAKLPAGMLQLSWGSACGGPDGYSVYRGDLTAGYGSAAPVPGMCAVDGPTAAVAAEPGSSEFFLVVPHLENLAGGYGDRPPPTGACFPQEALAGACASN